LCRGHRGIYVPQSGIVDYTKVGKKISSILKDTNGDILFGSEVKKITPGPTQTVILSDNNKVEGKKIIVTAGLHSDNNFGIRNLNLGVKIIPFKGEYYRLDCKDEQLNYNGTLIYPVPNPKFPFLGVHITPKMNGEIEVGPNALLSWNKENYSSSFNVKETFKILNNKALINFGIKNLNYAIQEKLNSLSPFLYKRKLSKLFNVENCELTKSRSGIRAQAMTKEGKLIEDFMIKRATNDIIFVCNAPSPAATSSFSIADEIIKYI
jgi:L-2-hydroxyglutarate oxidase